MYCTSKKISSNIHNYNLIYWIEKMKITRLNDFLNSKQAEMDGLTGIIKFDEDGFRSDFEVDIIEVMGHGFEKVCKSVIVYFILYSLEDSKILITFYCFNQSGCYLDSRRRYCSMQNCNSTSRARRF